MPSHLLCWNQVENVARWRKIFDSHRDDHLAAGLHLVHLWNDDDDASRIHYLFEVHNPRKARAFLSAPDATEAAKAAGVVDGGFHFVTSADGYHPASKG